MKTVSVLLFLFVVTVSCVIADVEPQQAHYVDGQHNPR